jgi:hypothetical protein
MSNFAGFSGVPKFSRKVTLDPNNILATTWLIQSFTVKGLRPGMVPVVHAPSLEAGVILASPRITAKDTLELSFFNTTAGAINPAAQSFEILGL